MLALFRSPRKTRPVRRLVQPTGQERFFREQDTIVSKTDTKGRITYANDVFMAVSGYREEELIGAPHSIIRHPAMPRCIFQLLWEEIAVGREIFAYVINLCKNGDHYWVLAHVSPTFDDAGQIVGHHSNRRAPARHILPKVEAIYRELLVIENGAADRKQGLKASRARLEQMLEPFGGSASALAFALAEQN